MQGRFQRKGEPSNALQAQRSPAFLGFVQKVAVVANAIIVAAAGVRSADSSDVLQTGTVRVSR